MSRVYNNPPALIVETLLRVAAPYVLGGIALYYIANRAKSDLPKKAAEVAKAAREIKAGLPGYVADKIMGRNDSGYITFAEQQKRAALNLNLVRSGFAPVVYGN